MSIVTIEGNICVGKTTLCNKLLKIGSVKIYKEDYNAEFLKLFYSNIPKYAFSFQMTMLSKRKHQFDLAKYDKSLKNNLFCIWDRSIIGDYSFALWNCIQGSISKKELHVYESEMGFDISNITESSFIKELDHIIYLYDSPTNCLDRILNVRKRESESSMTLEYLRGIDDIHFNIILKLYIADMSKVSVLMWGDYDNLEDFSLSPKTKLKASSYLEIGENFPDISIMSYDGLMIPTDKHLRKDIKPYGMCFYTQRFKNYVMQAMKKRIPLKML